MNKHNIWCEKYRPDSVDNYLGNESIKKDLTNWLQTQKFPNLLFYGKPGSGKTTISKMIANSIECDKMYINCSDENGIDIIRDKVKAFAGAASFRPLKVIIMDEADFLTINAQASLRSIIEQYSLSTRFIFTCNFIERIIEPLQSRLSPYELSPPTRIDIAKHVSNILELEGIEYDLGDAAVIINKFYPDIRKIINVLQTCCSDGTLVVDDKKFTSALQLQTIVEEINSKNSKAFGNIRQLVADNEIRDFTELYKGLYDSFTSPDATIIISEALYQSVTIPDKEICFMACISKLLQI